MENDLIRRSDILESLGDRPENWMNSDEEIQACADWDAFHGIVTRLPAVDAVEVVHGTWRDKRMTVKGGRGLTYGRWVCSKCKSKQEHRTHYCPACGARMDGRREDGDV